MQSQGKWREEGSSKNTINFGAALKGTDLLSLELREIK